MIGSNSKGSGFGGLLGYLLETRQGRILDRNLGHETAAGMAREFRAIANRRPTAQKVVRHFAIGFAVQDGEVADDIKIAIAEKLLAGLGYENNQYLIVAHPREDNHEHDHIHIVANAVDLDGNLVRDSWDYSRTEKILRQLETEYGLHQVASSNYRRQPKLESPDLDAKFSEAFSLSNDLPTYIDELRSMEIECRFNLSYHDNVKGISYVCDGKVYRGCDLGYGWNDISAKLNYEPERDLEVMQQANVVANAVNAKLDRHQKTQFDRLTQISWQMLDGKPQFKNTRLTLDYDPELQQMTLLRHRPCKVVLCAQMQADGSWQPVGLPNIQPKDVELIDRTSLKLGIQALDNSPMDNLKACTSIFDDRAVISVPINHSIDPNRINLATKQPEPQFYADDDGLSM